MFAAPRRRCCSFEFKHQGKLFLKLVQYNFCFVNIFRSIKNCFKIQTKMQAYEKIKDRQIPKRLKSFAFCVEVDGELYKFKNHRR